MTREEVARYIKKMDRYKDMEFIKRATVKEIARGLDITSNELKTITKEYLECPWDGYVLTKKEQEAIERNVNKAFEANREYPNYEYKYEGRFILTSKTRYEYIVFKLIGDKRYITYRGNDENKALKAEGTLVKFNKENVRVFLDKRFDGFKGFNI